MCSQGESGRLRLTIAPPDRADSYSRGGHRDNDSPYRQHRSSRDRDDSRGMPVRSRSGRDEYGPVRERYGRGSEDRSHSPVRRRRSPARRDEDSQYGGVDSRSTEPYSSRPTDRRRSPPRKESSWAPAAVVLEAADSRDTRGVCGGKYTLMHFNQTRVCTMSFATRVHYTTAIHTTMYAQHKPVNIVVYFLRRARGRILNMLSSHKTNIILMSRRFKSIHA